MSAHRDRVGTRCTATCKDGRPCSAWAQRGSDPPRCRSHRLQAQPQAQPSVAHRSSDVDGMILDLQRRLDQLSDYIDQGLNDAKLDIGDYARLTGLQGQLASRLGRLIRDRQSIAGDTDNQTLDALNAALNSISEEWGIEL